MRHAVEEFASNDQVSRHRLKHGANAIQVAANPDSAHRHPYDPWGIAVLQSVAGNRAVSQLLSTKKPNLSVQRCGPTGCTDCGQEQAHDSLAATQGIEGIAEEPLLAEQGVEQRAAERPDRPRSVQRAAAFAEGPVHEVNNLAQCVVDKSDIGLTLPVLNGAQISTASDARAALVTPTLSTAAVASGGFEARIGTVPTNNGSFDETVLAAGPWRHPTTKAIFAAMFPSVEGCDGEETTMFRALGTPTDKAVFKANRRHEDRHATDFKNVFNATIVPWDNKIVAAESAGTKFQGATAADAEAALWAAMGGTPEQIAWAFRDQCVASISAFHGTPAGGLVSATGDAGARSNCTICWAFFSSPA